MTDCAYCLDPVNDVDAVTVEGRPMHRRCAMELESMDVHVPGEEDTLRRAALKEAKIKESRARAR